jgi:hypothetical protein
MWPFKKPRLEPKPYFSAKVRCSCGAPATIVMYPTRDGGSAAVFRCNNRHGYTVTANSSFVARQVIDKAEGLE